MFFDPNGTLTSLLYCITETMRTTPSMMIELFKSSNCTSLTASFRDYTTVASSVNDVEYYCLHLAYSYCSSTSPILSDGTCNLVINQRFTNLPSLPPKSPYHLETKALGAAGKSLLTLFVPNSKAQGAMMKPFGIHMVQKTLVTATITKPYRRQKLSLL